MRHLRRLSLLALPALLAGCAVYAPPPPRAAWGGPPAYHAGPPPRAYYVAPGYAPPPAYRPYRGWRG